MMKKELKGNVLVALSLFVMYVHETCCENIIREECGVDARFYKVASNFAMNDNGNVTNTTNLGYMGCVDLCIEYPLCKAFNFKQLMGADSICELLHKDRTTNPHDVVSRSGWSYYDTGLFSSQIGQFCRSLTYNPCYPCLCMDSCNASVGYTCKCTEGSPPLPDIYLSFEKTLDGNATKSPYDRGKDIEGKSIVTLMSGTDIGSSTGRPGNVLRMTGTSDGADAGNFKDHTLNDPTNHTMSIALWVRVVAAGKGHQVFFRTGFHIDPRDTGIQLRVKGSGKFINCQAISAVGLIRIREVKMQDALQTWVHIVIKYLSEGNSEWLEIYLNGRRLVRDTSPKLLSSSTIKNPNLLFGKATAADLSSDIHIDDFAFWDGYLLSKNEIVHIMNKGYVPDIE